MHRAHGEGETLKKDIDLIWKKWIKPKKQMRLRRGNGNGKTWLRIWAGHEKILDRNFEAVEAKANT